MSRINSFDTVLISGPGTIGLLSQQVAQAEGGSVIVCGTSNDIDRLAKAQELGALYTIDLDNGNLESIKDYTDGLGVDLAI